MARCTDIIPKYWVLLVEEMRETGDFNVARLKQALLRQTHYAERSVTLPRTDNFVPRQPIFAHIARLKTQDEGCQEIALAFVRKDKEGNGYLSEIIEELLAKAPPGFDYFGITKKAPVSKVFVRHGLMPITKAVMPDVEEWATRVGLGDRLPENALRTDPPNPIEGERWLFIRIA